MKKRVSHLHRMNAFDYVNYGIMIILCLLVIYPIWYLIMLSFSSYQGMIEYNGMGMLTPQGFTLSAYERYFKLNFIRTGYYATIFRTVVGTSLSMIVMALGGYALSKKKMPFHGVITGLIVFTMFFNGGLIPTYLQVKSLGLIDSLWALVLPCLMNTFYMLVLRNFYMGIPEALEESARIDGASDLRIFAQIILPISMPSLMTITLWVAVNHWNSWFDSSIYISSSTKQVIQVHIRNLVIEQENGLSSQVMTFNTRDKMPTPETMRAAAIMITMVPILCVYPFIQKYFVKGVIVGSLKG